MAGRLLTYRIANICVQSTNIVAITSLCTFTARLFVAQLSSPAIMGIVLYSCHFKRNLDHMARKICPTVLSWTAVRAAGRAAFAAPLTEAAAAAKAACCVKEKMAPRAATIETKE